MGALAVAVLTWLSGELKNQQVPIEGQAILGRGKHVQIVLDDRRSSREHARVFLKDDEYWIEDLGSSNGTFLNEAAVGKEPVKLKVGDNVRIGLSWFCFGEPKIAEDQLSTFVGYEITRQILHHQGGMLIEAVQEGLDRKVHLRLLSMQIATNAQYIHHQFIQEVKTVAKLVHPNIALLLDFGSRNLFLYAAFEALEGEELKGYVEAHHPLAVPRVLEIARGIARGMEYAERQGVTHLRLQPEVVLLTRGRPIIRDFGMSRLAGEMTRDAETGLADVSPYMAPEMLKGGAGDIKSDVYAFGMILAFLLGGKPPYPQTSPYELAEAIQGQPPVDVRALRPDAPEHLLQAIADMTRRDPAQRLAGYGAVLERLDDCGELALIDDVLRASAARAKSPHLAALDRLLRNPLHCWIAFPGAAIVAVILMHLLS